MNQTPTSPSKKILIACGGTGGHLFPGIAVAEQLQSLGHHPHLLVSEKKIDTQASAKYTDLDFTVVPAIPSPPFRSPRIVPFAFSLLNSIRRCQHLLKSLQIDVVLGMGGFTSFPPIFAAARRKLPCYVHDSNALPGKANRYTSRFCNAAFIGLEPARQYFTKCPVELTGTPVRSELNHLPDREVAAQRFQLSADQPTVLVMGGSQGARHLNSMVLTAAPLMDANWQILHLAGPNDAQRVRAELPDQLQSRYQVLDFCDDMPAAYACSDVAICRAGASSLTELAHLGLPSLLVPYPYAADDHQTHNAMAFTSVGAARQVQESDLSPEQIQQFLDNLLTHPEQREQMANAAKQLAAPDAAATIAKLITQPNN